MRNGGSGAIYNLLTMIRRWSFGWNLSYNFFHCRISRVFSLDISTCLLCIFARLWTLLLYDDQITRKIATNVDCPRSLCCLLDPYIAWGLHKCAFTSSGYTNYYFGVITDCFDEALDRQDISFYCSFLALRPLLSFFLIYC